MDAAGVAPHDHEGDLRAQEISIAVRRVTEAFNKPADRQKLYEAVHAAVLGQMTIKEASVHFGLATSTMHPYVHRARAVLGDRAPPLKSMRIPPGRISYSSQQSKHEETPSGLDLIRLTTADNKQKQDDKMDSADAEFEAVMRVARETVGIKQEEIQEDKPETKFVESAEDAAREAIDSSDLADADRQQLFLAIVRCLRGDCSPKEAAQTADPQSLITHLNCARGLMGLEPVDLQEPEESSAVAGAFTIPADASIDDVTRQITNGSHYHGSNKERLYKAVLQTVKGELPLTQAAATHSIPFSTLHPYVKKVRLVLGQIEPDEGKDARLLSGLKDFWNGKRFASSSSGESPPQKKARRQVFTSPNPDFKPFKRIEIPERWKNDAIITETMESIVRQAVQNCQYDDPSKKERLYNAVLEALSGKKTMKAAAAMYLVPFTTLQTYFHRSRAALQRATGELPCDDPLTNEEAEMDLTNQDSPEQMDLEDMDTVPNTLVMLGSALNNNEEPTAKRACDGLWDKLRLRSQLQTNGDDAGAVDELANQKSEVITNAAPSGANKRKPKKVVHNSAPSILPQEEESWINKLEDASGSTLNVSEGGSVDYMKEFKELWGSNPNSEQNMEIVEPRAPEELDSYLNISSSSEDLEENWDSITQINLDEISKKNQISPEDFTDEVAVDKAIKNSHYEGALRLKLRKALLDGLRGKNSLKSAATLYGVPLGTLHTYYQRSKTLLEAVRAGQDPVEVLQMTASAVNAAARRKKDMESGLYDGLNQTCDKDTVIEEAVHRVVRSSLYPPEQKEQLRQAVLQVVRGELTINAAANMHHLPSSTVHPYVHRARAAIGFGAVEGDKDQILTTSSNSSAAGSTPPPSLSVQTNGDDSPSASVTPEPSQPSRKKIKEWPREMLSARAVIKEVKEATKLAKSRAQLESVNLEDADKVVTDLVRSSLYDEQGRQRLYEAVLMVVTDSATSSEAARTYQIPPSTIQPYVQRARATLNLPNHSAITMVNGSHSTPSPVASSSRRSKSGCAQGAPMVYAKPGQEASEQEIEEVVRKVVKVVKNDAQADVRREKLFKAVFSAVSGQSTIKDACTAHKLPASTVHPYVSRARHILGAKCPPPKIVVTGTAPSTKTQTQTPTQTPIMPTGITAKADPEHKSNATVTISYLPSQLKEPKSEPNAALRMQLENILDRYNFRGDKARLLDAIAYVIGEKKTLADASALTGIAQTTLSTYARIAKLFMDRDEPPELDSKPLFKTEAPPNAVVVPTFESPKPVNEESEEMSENVTQILDSEKDTETRLQALSKYMVALQYKRGAQAQSLLVEAVEDVLLNGLSHAEALKCRSASGLSENVLNVYVGRVKGAQALFDHPLSDLHRKVHLSKSKAKRSSSETPPKRSRKSSSRVTSPQPSPTRISRRLQAKAEKKEEEEEPEEKWMLTAELEKTVIAFLKRLESVNFPLSAGFVSRLLESVTGCQLNGEQNWPNWWSGVRKANAFK